MTQEQTDRIKELKGKKEPDARDKSELELLESLAKAEKDLETETERIGGMQTQIEKWGTEMGDMRKSQEEFFEKNGKQMPPKSKEGGDKEKEEKAAKEKADADELQKGLVSTEKGKKALEDAWGKMSPEQQTRMGTDYGFRLEVYRTAKTLLPDEAPKMPWDTSGDPGKDEEGEVAALFGKKKDSRQAPNGKRTPGTPNKEEKSSDFDGNYSDNNFTEDTRVK